MTAPTTSSTTVHLEIPGFEALSEHGNWGACGIIAEMAALHVCPWGNMPFDDAAATDAKCKQWIAEYHAAGRASSTGITTLTNIRWHLGLHANHIAGYIPYADVPNLTALHAFVKAQALAQNPIIIEIGNAAALPHNEAGIQFHFVVLGGIDSTAGYLVANGDTTDALSSTALTVPTYWATWQQLVNAKLCGALAVDRAWQRPQPPTPPPTPPPVANTLQLVESALSALQLAKAQLGG